MKPKNKKKRHKTINRSPGTVLYKGKKVSPITAVEITHYDKEYYDVIKTQNIEDTFNYANSGKVTWINVNGLNNATHIEQLGAHYGLHPLTLEDIVNTTHRPKIDEFEDYIFIILKMLYINNDNQLVFEQLSLIVGSDFVITFQEADGDVFDDLRLRIASSKGRGRSLGSDYLMYALIDAVVDHYLEIIEIFGDKIEDLEDVILEKDTNEDMSSAIQNLKREVLKIRRSTLPLREVINRLDKTDHSIIKEKTHSFLNDLYDHIVQANETIEVYREMVWSLLNLHMSVVSNRMNEVMKLLTIIATVFIPLTFIAGIYGMNFDYMPELHYKHSYFILLGIMFLIIVIMLRYFRKKKWL